jgi:hypothetical protein
MIQSYLISKATDYFDFGNIINVKKINIKGYKDLIFRLNDSEYSIKIFKEDGTWEWYVNGEFPLKKIIFNSELSNDIIINVLFGQND